MADNSTPSPLWTPSPQRAAASEMAAFMRRAAAKWGRDFPDYAALWQWSVEKPEQFWAQVWSDCGIVGEMGDAVLRDGDKMPGAQWFPQARLNYAENLLRHKGAQDAIVFRGEDGSVRRLSRDELRREVAKLAAALRSEGVRAGDRVACLLPNAPEAIIALLAASAIGAVFSSASPDFGTQGVMDRFGQIEPKVVISCDGYRYNGKIVDIRGRLAEILPRLPSVKRLAIVGFVEAKPDIAALGGKAVSYADFVAPHANLAEPAFERMGFSHPLYILYSSGTTGVPKCIVHCAGGALIQHLKEHSLHGDLREGDRLFYFTTLGWMMWNWLASGLATGATLLLYDGSPFMDDGKALFDYAAAEKCTHFGVGAKFIDACMKAGLKPKDTHDLHYMRAIFSTGSPLSPDNFEYVYRDVKPDVLLASISGGTDIVSCFVLGNPILPVHSGEIQCRGLGMAVDVYDDDGRGVRGDRGELVCAKPFPIMPTGFWNDPDGRKYHDAYFARFPNVWCHGDFAEITPRGGVIIYGRSDATLKPGGVRIGTAEIYRQVEKLPEVAESVAIGQEWDGDTRIVLFVRLREEMVLDDALRERIKRQVREGATPRHVPARIAQVTDIPRTRSGKTVELAIRETVHGRPVKNLEALANPEALRQFANREELKS